MSQFQSEVMYSCYYCTIPAILFNSIVYWLNIYYVALAVNFTTLWPSLYIYCTSLVEITLAELLYAEVHIVHKWFIYCAYPIKT